MSNAFTAAISTSYHRAASRVHHVGEDVSHKFGALKGRTTEWLNTTSSASALKTAAWGTLTAGLSVLGVAAIVKAVAAFIFAFGAISAGAGSLVVLTSVALGVTLTAATVLATKCALSAINKTHEHYQQTLTLAQLGK